MQNGLQFVVVNFCFFVETLLQKLNPLGVNKKNTKKKTNTLLTVINSTQPFLQFLQNFNYDKRQKPTKTQSKSCVRKIKNKIAKYVYFAASERCVTCKLYNKISKITIYTKFRGIHLFVWPK